MSLTDQVREAIASIETAADHDEALRRAEMLADQFADVKPAPFAIPIERFVGMAVECRANRSNFLALEERK